MAVTSAFNHVTRILRLLTLVVYCLWHAVRKRESSVICTCLLPTNPLADMIRGINKGIAAVVRPEQRARQFLSRVRDFGMFLKDRRRRSTVPMSSQL